MNKVSPSLSCLPLQCLNTVVHVEEVDEDLLEEEEEEAEETIDELDESAGVEANEGGEQLADVTEEEKAEDKAPDPPSERWVVQHTEVLVV